SHGVLHNGNQIDYALGLSLGDYRGLQIVEHNGALFGYHSAFLRFPQQRFSVIVLCNSPPRAPKLLPAKSLTCTWHPTSSRQKTRSPRPQTCPIRRPSPEPTSIRTRRPSLCSPPTTAISWHG